MNVHGGARGGEGGVGEGERGGTVGYRGGGEGGPECEGGWEGVCGMRVSRGGGKDGGQGQVMGGGEEEEGREMEWTGVTDRPTIGVESSTAPSWLSHERSALHLSTCGVWLQREGVSCAGAYVHMCYVLMVWRMSRCLQVVSRAPFASPACASSSSAAATTLLCASFAATVLMHTRSVCSSLLVLACLCAPAMSHVDASAMLVHPCLRQP